MIRLIISADDFGIHSSINQAVEESFTKGCLTSASIVPSGAAVDEAILIAKRNPGLGIGLHFTLVDEAPVSPLSQIPDLVGENGLFHSNHFKIARSVLTGKIPKKQIQIELRAQIEFCLDHGLNLTHLDGHRHLHVLPGILSVVTEEMNRYGIKHMRYLNSPMFEWQWQQPLKLVLAGLFSLYGRLFLRRSKFLFPDNFIGFFESGQMNIGIMLEFLQKLKTNKTYEISFHPGINDRILRSSFGSWDNLFPYDFSWQTDFETLTSSRVISEIREAGIALMSYKELAK